MSLDRGSKDNHGRKSKQGADDSKRSARDVLRLKKIFLFYSSLVSLALFESISQVESSEGPGQA